MLHGLRCRGAPGVLVKRAQHGPAPLPDGGGWAASDSSACLRKLSRSGAAAVPGGCFIAVIATRAGRSSMPKGIAPLPTPLPGLTVAALGAWAQPPSHAPTLTRKRTPSRRGPSAAGLRAALRARLPAQTGPSPPSGKSPDRIDQVPSATAANRSSRSGAGTGEGRVRGESVGETGLRHLSCAGRHQHLAPDGNAKPQPGRRRATRLRGAIGIRVTQRTGSPATW